MYFYGYRQYESQALLMNQNIMSYNSTCIELLRSLLFTLYIYIMCARQRAELARGQRRWVIL